MIKKAMYRVMKNHINEEPCAVTVYCDEEKGSIDFYYTEEEYYLNVTKFDEFFETKEEAVLWQHDFKFLLLSKMSEVKDYLQMMDDFVDDDEKSEFYHKKADYLYSIEADSLVYWKDSYVLEFRLRSKYMKLAVNGVISLHNHSILYTEVEQAYKHDGKVVLQLKSMNSDILVTEEVDKLFCSQVFGLID